MLSKFFKTTSCHGISSIQSIKSTKLKVLWVLVLLLSFSLLVCLLVRIIWRFANNPTVTSINFKVMEEEAPKVLVCQGRYLRLSFLKQKNISDRLAHYIQAVLGGRRKRMRFSPEEEGELDQQYQRLLQAYPNEDVRELFMEAGPNCTSMFTQCMDGYEEYDALGCCQNLLEEKVDKARGKCFLFNRHSEMPRPGIGLWATVRLKLDDYFPSVNDDMIGLVLKIYPSYNPFELTEVKIPPGYHALFELEKEVTIMANSPLRTVCNGSSEKSEFQQLDECRLEKDVDIYGCSRDLLDLSAFNGRFFRVCSPKEFARIDRMMDTDVVAYRAFLQVYIPFFCSQYKNFLENSILSSRILLDGFVFLYFRKRLNVLHPVSPPVKLLATVAV